MQLSQLNKMGLFSENSVTRKLILLHPQHTDHFDQCVYIYHCDQFMETPKSLLALRKIKLHSRLF